jgi:hypothetical protein
VVNIVLVNASPVLSDAAVLAVLPALQKWDRDMLAPAYGFEPCRYSFLSWTMYQREPSRPDEWPIFLNRHSSDASALGFHDDPAGGHVYGRVFVGDCIRYGISWTVDLSHEAAEMRGNPTLDKTFKMPDGRLSLWELADPVEDDSFAIDVDGVKLSDFVMPDYWSSKTVGQFDYGRHLTGPCPTLTPGGYQSIYDGQQWTQMTAMFMGGPPSYRSSRFHNGMRRPKGDE